MQLWGQPLAVLLYSGPLASGQREFNDGRYSLITIPNAPAEELAFVESIVYPRKGALRMDGIFGGAKPRVLSALMPAVFFVLFLAFFVWILVGYLAVAN